MPCQTALLHLPSFLNDTGALQARNSDVYDGTIHELVLGCMKGLNVTVFAYGATGSGKTYTMVGKPEDPGLMVLSLERIFRDRQDLYGDEDFDVTCSYIEVYNEVIYDLLVRNSGPLELREDPSLGVQVAGIKKHMVKSPQEIMALLEQGNTRRKTEATNANATSSRSHAVLEVNIVRKPRNQYKTNVLRSAKARCKDEALAVTKTDLPLRSTPTMQGEAEPGGLGGE